ncbi:MAG: nucleotidyltransferase family protein [Propioniciclava sp.]
MRKPGAGVALTPDQERVAASGVKAMVSVGRPFLDHVLSELADAGFTDVVLVIGPEHDQIRDHYRSLPLHRVRIRFAVQEQPLGTANAVQAAATVVGDDRFLVINSDNFYPAEALRQLHHARGAATLGFEAATLVAQSNIPAERVDSYALLTTDEDGFLSGIVEKPTPAQRAALGARARVSMNAWLLTPAFFPAANSIGRSSRGEYELADAALAMIQAGEWIEVIGVESGSLDLARRSDIAAVAAALADHQVYL